jgi:hypothetical protein
MTQAEINALKVQLAEALAAKDAAEAALAAKVVNRNLSLKVGVAGTVCVYGLTTRFPVALYMNQWAKLIAMIPEIQAFIEANKANLSTGADDTRFAEAKLAAKLAYEAKKNAHS